MLDGMIPSLPAALLSAILFAAAAWAAPPPLDPDVAARVEKCQTPCFPENQRCLHACGDGNAFQRECGQRCTDDLRACNRACWNEVAPGSFPAPAAPTPPAPSPDSGSGAATAATSATASASAPTAPASRDVAPVTAAQLRQLGEVLDDTAAYVETLRRNRVRCSGGLAWKDRGFIKVQRKMGETCKPWKAGEKAWDRDQSWILANRGTARVPYRAYSRACPKDMGFTPVSWMGYCTRCPAPYDVTAKALRGDAENLRKMAAYVECMERLLANAPAAATPTRAAKKPRRRRSPQDR